MLGGLLPGNSLEEEEEEGGVGGCESYSDSGSESDDGRHDNLLSAIAALKGNRKRKAGHRSEATPTVSEYHLPQQDGTGDHVTVRELLAGLEGGHGLSHLRKRLTTKKEGGVVLEPPLPRPQADRVQRAVAYREVSESISKWIPIVKKNREAEHLSFPLQEERPPLPSLTTRVEGFKPVTELELEVAAVLEGSENVKEADGEGEGLSEAEQKALLRMSLEEAHERRRELQRSRALLSYYEQKTRRTGKIKSKKYHRMQRRKREAAGARREGVEEGEEEMEKADRIRAKERMTLKHGSMARWARQQQARGHRDQATQQALTEHHQRRKELKQRTVAEEESDSESESEYSESAPSEEESSLSQHTPTPHSSTNPWLNASGGGGRKRSQPKVSGHEDVLLLDPQPGIHPLATVSPSRGGGGKVAGVGKGDGSEGPPSDFEPEEDPGESDSEGEGRSSKGRGRSDAVAKGIKKTKTSTKADSSKSVVKGKSDSLKSQEKKSLDHVKKASGQSATSSKTSFELADKALSSDAKGPLSSKTDIKDRRPAGGVSHDIDPTSYMLAEEGGVALGGASQHLLNIQEAFAGEDVVGEFQREKAEVEEGSRPKEVDLTLPGWGVWGGEGVKPHKKRRKVVRPAEPEKPRKDTGLEHVIISETHDPKASKHQVSSLPWPYTSTEQFEKTLSGPVGRHWTSEASFRQLIRPAVRTAVGSIVEPLKMTEDVQDFIKRTEKKGRGKRGRREGTEKDGVERRQGKGGRRRDKST